MFYYGARNYVDIGFNLARKNYSLLSSEEELQRCTYRKTVLKFKYGCSWHGIFGVYNLEESKFKRQFLDIIKGIMFYLS